MTVSIREKRSVCKCQNQICAVFVMCYSQKMSVEKNGLSVDVDTGSMRSVHNSGKERFCPVYL